MTDLWERLRAQAGRAVPPTGPSPHQPGEAAPPGWTWQTPLLAVRRLRLPLLPQFGALVGPVVTGGPLCLDTETTGLSGGAGTVAFLVGWARLTSAPQPEAEVVQWFLRDLPGEPDLIAAVDVELRAAGGLCSFNGASFDLPLLRGRWALAGRDFPALPHRDLLPLARRLWKRLLPSCRLADIEEAVLGIRRSGDVPGALVPALWLEYLRSGAPGDFVSPLGGVLEHHAQDVYSLLCLDLLLGALLRDPASALWSGVAAAPRPRAGLLRPAGSGLLHPDLRAPVAIDRRALVALLDPAAGEAVLTQSWLAEGREADGLALADRWKRRRDPEAATVWRALWSERRSYPALIELLKWLEHRDRSPAALTEALCLVSEGLAAPFLPRPLRQDLERRRIRLSERLSRAYTAGHDQPLRPAQSQRLVAPGPGLAPLEGPGRP